MQRDEPRGVIFISTEQVIALHSLIIKRVTPSESTAILDRGRLEAAIMQPQQTFDGLFVYK